MQQTSSRPVLQAQVYGESLCTWPAAHRALRRSEYAHKEIDSGAEEIFSRAAQMFGEER